MKQKLLIVLMAQLRSVVCVFVCFWSLCVSAEEPITEYFYDMECELDGLIFRFYFPDDFETTLKGEVYFVGVAPDAEAASRAISSSKKKICYPAQFWAEHVREMREVKGDKLNKWMGEGLAGNYVVTGMSALKARPRTSDSKSLVKSDAPRKTPQIDNDKTYKFDLKLICGGAFEGWEGLTELEIPNTVTTIWHEAFKNCKDLEKLIIPNSVVSIWWGCFDGCTSLTDLTLPEGLVSIEPYTFRNCTSLAQINVPHQVDSIAWRAFYGCSNLTDISISNSVKSIGENAFNGCGLKSLVIPNSVKTIGWGCFIDCTSLTDVTLPEGLKNIEYNTFSGCTNLTTITLNEGLESIVAHAFDGCPIKEITIPSTVSKIEEFTFSRCEQLQSVTFTEGLESIGDFAFEYCTSLKSVSLPESLVRMGEYAFNGCESLASVYIPNGLTRLEESTFGSCSSLSKIEFGNDSQLQYIGPECFAFCESLKEFDMPDRVSVLAEGDSGVGIFTGSPIWRLKLSAALKSIPNYLGVEESLTTLSFGENSQLTAIEEGAFWGYTKLKQITLPEGVKTIGSGAFDNCTSLETVSFPSTLKTIGGALFLNCKAVKDVYCYSTTPPVVNDYTLSEERTLEGSYILNRDFYSNATLHVPYGTARLYLVPQEWNFFDYYGAIVEIDAPEIPEGMIGFADFRTRTLCLDNWDTNGDGFLSKEEAAAVTDLGTVFKYDSQNALTNITSFDELQYFTGLTSIPDNAFYDSEKMTSIILPKNITSIGEYAFAYCSNLTTVSIGKSVKSIGNGAFYQCSDLKTVTSYMKNPPSINDNVFQYYDKEKGDYAFTAATLVVPAGTKAKYQATNGWKNFTEIVEMEASDTTGDVNGDKSVNAKDIVAIADIIATGGYDDAADLNGDNVVNIADIIILVNKLTTTE